MWMNCFCTADVRTLHCTVITILIFSFHSVRFTVKPLAGYELLNICCLVWSSSDLLLDIGIHDVWVWTRSHLKLLTGWKNYIFTHTFCCSHAGSGAFRMRCELVGGSTSETCQWLMNGSTLTVPRRWIFRSLVTSSATETLPFLFFSKTFQQLLGGFPGSLAQTLMFLWIWNVWNI